MDVSLQQIMINALKMLHCVCSHLNGWVSATDATTSYQFQHLQQKLKNSNFTELMVLFDTFEEGYTFSSSNNPSLITFASDSQKHFAEWQSCCIHVITH